MSNLAKRLASLIETAMSERTGKPATCSPSDIYFAQGAHRTSRHLDVARWEAVCFVDDLSYDMQSWDTATACVKDGVVISECYGAIFAHAKP